MSSENPGLISGAIDKLYTPFRWADEAETQRGKNFRASLVDLGMIALGVSLLALPAIFGGMTHPFSGAQGNIGQNLLGYYDRLLSGGSLTGIMMMVPAIGLIGVGMAWLIEDALGKKAARLIGKVMALALPIIIAATAGALMGAALTQSGGPVAGLSSYLFFIGLVMLPLSFWAASEKWGNSREKGIFLDEQSHQSTRNRRVEELASDRAQESQTSRIRRRGNEIELQRFDSSETSSPVQRPRSSRRRGGYRRANP